MDNLNSTLRVRRSHILLIQSMDEERLLYRLITSNIPPRIQDLIFDAIEEFEQSRSI
ncbi:MAG: hypothetical protein JSW11_15965 [Candidatus Heimdallarchaeota archaeon]|nr:MAG: hypothetical protein JSW11_15965 [Candidatus Heimdallarchaeota archaeon]